MLGSVWLPDLTDGELAIGQRRVDRTITAAVVTLDGEPADVEPELPEGSVTSRIRASLPVAGLDGDRILLAGVVGARPYLWSATITAR